MAKYRVEDIMTSFGIFIDDEIEAEDECDAKDQIMNEIMDNIGNYIDIELEEIFDDAEEDEE